MVGMTTSARSATGDGRPALGVGRGAAALAVGLVLVLAASACAGLPGGGDVQVVRSVMEGTAAAAPQGPQSGQQPDQIVREFLHASALTEFDTAGESFVAARQFLTPSAAESWNVGDLNSQIAVLADDFSVIRDPDDPGKVTLAGRQTGVVLPDRSYEPVDSAEYRAEVRLALTDGEWRISRPLTDIVITEGDFQTALRQRTVYFLDSTGRVVVPDIRYLPNTSAAELTVNRLMELLLRGPSRRISDSARTQLGPRVELESNVQIDEDGIAHVNLDGVEAVAPNARLALAAQIVWTLDPDVQQIAITVNGLSLSVSGATVEGSGGAVEEPASQESGSGETIFSLLSGTLANFSPDRVPGSAQAVSDAYYVDGGSVLRLSDSAPLWGSVGTGSVPVVSASLSAATGALAAVARDGSGGQQLVVGWPFDHLPVVTALKATTLTKPSFTRWGYAAWTVQNGETQPEVYQVSVTTGDPTWTRVSAPGLADLGPVTALELSPDGVRVALVANHVLYVGVVVVSESDLDPEERGPTSDAAKDRPTISIAGLEVLRADLTDVGPIAWDDSVNLLIGARQARSVHRSVFQVSVDGQSVDPITTAQTTGTVFADVDAIAASDSDLPMLISFGGNVWQLQGNRTSGQWVPPDGRNWMTGTAPFYPN